MSELAFASTPAQELLSARTIATLLKITPRAVRLRMASVAPVLSNGIQTWPLDLLPADYQDELQFAKKRSGAWTISEAAQFATPRWEPDFALASLPEFSQLKAHKVRAVMITYFDALDRGLSPHEARCAGRSKWLEEFAASCSDKTIIRWVDKIDERGGVEWARIEAYADRKACPHPNQRLENRVKQRVPGELIRAFKVLCVQPDMNLAAAYRKLEMDWQCGREVPGIGKHEQTNQLFPFKITQLRKFAPSAATRELGNRGKAAALRDVLPHITRTYADLRPCELYVMDDTRINVTVLSDLSGKAVELKCYIAMEVASRKIVGYVLREGNMRAGDVDALMARVLRTSGLAHPRAGYKTCFLFERGTVACSPQRETLLEAAFPGRLEIRRTSMDGGQNVPGDYVQANSGHWMGKGVIESFMRTLGYMTRHIKGQRGSTYATAPTMVGYPNDAHAGSQVDEAQRVAQAARGAVLLQSNATNLSPDAREAVQAMDLKIDLLFFSQFRQAFAQSIAHYNQETDHRREGFRQIGVEQSEGGIRYRFESSDERWAHLVWTAEQMGKAPERICPADASMLLHKARPVTFTKQGVEITVENLPYRYSHPNSIAFTEAGALTGSKKEYIALVDTEDLSGIYLLQNKPSSWKEGDVSQFLEWLPLYKKAGAMDREALGRASEEKRRVHNRATYELTQITEGMIQERTDDRASNTSKMHGVVATTVGYNEASSVSGLLKGMKRERRKAQERPAQQQGSDSRHTASASDLDDYVATFNQPKESA